ncbi:hypothetical protein PFLmoz3_01479 [Pseudomonas fluorescens]|uniref:Uncharacterized protein n=1 Tax=Pseudomonas fluorescens TaxID=294 RepID=A0A125QIS4_PSEFL|nr:hypothetical protein PFLmoz3_01479 [Pseudomonas fluorescens]
MARQVAGDHHEVLVQRPIHHMAIQPHVIVETVEQEHRRHWRWRPPDLGHHLEPIHLQAPQAAHRRHLTCGQVEPVETLVNPRLG